MDAYLSRCTAAGFTWEKADNFSKYNAYRIEGGGFVAYLIADHEEKWILFTQPGMTLETNINLDDFIFPEDEAVSVPLYFQHALICAPLRPAVRQFLKKHPSGMARPQEIKVPFVKNGE